MPNTPSSRSRWALSLPADVGHRRAAEPSRQPGNIRSSRRSQPSDDESAGSFERARRSGPHRHHRADRLSSARWSGGKQGTRHRFVSAHAIPRTGGRQSRQHPAHLVLRHQRRRRAADQEIETPGSAAAPERCATELEGLVGWRLARRRPTRSPSGFTTSGSIFHGSSRRYHMWNKHLSNRPGTTLFLPVVDMTQSFISVVLNILSEPEAERARSSWTTGGRSCRRTRSKSARGSPRVLVLFPSGFRISRWAGIEWARSGALNPSIRVPLGLERTFQVDYRSHSAAAESGASQDRPSGSAGGCTRTCLRRSSIRGSPRKASSVSASGCTNRTWEWHQWPPTPSTLPNPVGLDGVLEALAVRRTQVDGRSGRSGARGEIRQPGDLPGRGAVRARVSSIRNAEKYLQQAAAVFGEDRRVHEGLVPLHLRHLRAVPGARRRVSRARRVDAVLAPRLEYCQKYFDPALRETGGARGRCGRIRGQVAAQVRGR